MDTNPCHSKQGPYLAPIIRSPLLHHGWHYHSVHWISWFNLSFSESMKYSQPIQNIVNYQGLIKKTTMPITLSKELYQFFEQSAIWFRKLHGAWDPTLTPLSQFYGLQPSDLTITKANALQQIGFDNVVF